MAFFLALAGCSAPAPSVKQQQSAEIKAAYETLVALVGRDLTGDPFYALNQTRAKYAVLLMDESVARRFNLLTQLVWAAQTGRDPREADCYLRGFAFGSVEHRACVFELKMRD